MKKDKKKNKAKDSTLAEKEIISVDHGDEIKRLNRIAGQIDGIRKMLEGNRQLGDVLIQFKAVHSALRSIEQRVFENYVEHCVNGIADAEKRKNREEKIEELLELFKHV